jgi:transporter family-2 protein
LLGATVVFNTILCVPHIGVLPTLMAMILGNLIMGCVIDHFGWFGIPVTLFTWRRFLGVLLVLLGLLIAFKR